MATIGELRCPDGKLFARVLSRQTVEATPTAVVSLTMRGLQAGVTSKLDYMEVPSEYHPDLDPQRFINWYTGKLVIEGASGAALEGLRFRKLDRYGLEELRDVGY